MKLSKIKKSGCVSIIKNDVVSIFNSPVKNVEKWQLKMILRENNVRKIVDKMQLLLPSQKTKSVFLEKKSTRCVHGASANAISMEKAELWRTCKLN